jgi:hypothetical protein
MYLEDEEKTGFQKLIITLNAACAAIFRVSGKILKFMVWLFAGDANQNGKVNEVNS